MYAMLISTEPPTPWASLAGRWATSTRRGMTWLATEPTRENSCRRPAGSASTINVRPTRMASAMYAQCGGVRALAALDEPAMAAEISTSTPKTANDMTWVPPTLAAASAALSLALRRYRTFRATPPTAAGVTSITNEAATCTRKVRSVFSRSSTKPEIARVAPTYVAAEQASAIRLHLGFACASSLENETLASWLASTYAAKTPAISAMSIRGLIRANWAGITAPSGAADISR